MIAKIASTLYQTEYKYLDYLNHILTQCEQSTTIECGCPFKKCKVKTPLSID